MNPERLLAHFEQISEAPGAVARLRSFILDLAVRGKLVEPPKSWLECTLGDVGEWGSGGTPLRTKSEYYGGNIPWLVIGDLNDGLVTASATTITEEGLSNSSAKIVDEGTLLIAMYGSIGKLGIAGMRCATNQAIAFCRPYSDMVTRDYLFVLLKSLRNELLEQGQGVAQQNISQKILKAHPVELPPLAEQHRIVAKVDELMALCDQLEAARQQREQQRERLLAATLQRLNQPAEDPDTARDDARFALQVLPSLTTTPAQIKQLRQTILNLAVRGKLVEQDPEDEPAVEWAGRLDILNRLIEIEDPLYEVPEGWHWFSMAHIFDVAGGIQKTPKRAPRDNPYPYLGVANVYRGRLDLSEVKEFELEPGEIERRRLKPADLLIIEGNGSLNEIGRCAKWSGEIANCVHQNHVIRCRPCDPGISDFSLLFLNSPSGMGIMQRLAITSSGLYSLSVGKIRKIEIPLPPLAEQHRIVAKVDELMALCDQLEQQLSQADQQRRRLLEAVLAEALREPVKVMEGVTA